MPNMEVTEIDNGHVIITAEPYHFEDGLLTFAGLDTFAMGTILARNAGKFVPFVPGTNTAIAVLPHAVSSPGAGDVPVRALVAGTVNKRRLVIDNGTPLTAAHCDALRSFGIVPVDVQQLSPE